MTHDTPLLGAHASALMKLRSKSLEAYGIDPKALILYESYALTEVEESRTRALAKSKKEERALAVQEEHSIVLA